MKQFSVEKHKHRDEIDTASTYVHKHSNVEEHFHQSVQSRFLTGARSSIKARIEKQLGDESSV